MRFIRLLIFILLLPLCALYSSEDFKTHCFKELNLEELKTEWAKEYSLGIRFAQIKEYEEAIHSFKRAHLLCLENFERAKEIEYAIVLTNYLNQNYSEAIRFFETHSLLYTDQTFPAYHDLMVLLFHSYELTKQYKKSDLIFQRIEELSIGEAEKLAIAKAVYRKDFKTIDQMAEKNEDIKKVQNLTSHLLKNQKSKKLAKWFNILLPGLGYYYLGQKKAALTSFVLNAVLIMGAAHFFMKQYYALGSITSLLEIGWFVGSIFGAEHSTSIYNENLYTSYAEKIFFQESLQPENMIYYAF